MDRDSLELRTTVSADGTLRLHLEPVSLPDPGPGQLLVRVEAAPINPSDLGLMFGPADMATLTRDGDGLTARIPDAAMPGLRARIRVDAFAESPMTGTVESVSPMADQTSFFNSDVKVYSTLVPIDKGVPGLRPGMTAEVTILITELSDVLSVRLEGRGYYTALEEESDCSFCDYFYDEDFYQGEVNFGLALKF